jgi:hypothetical protein
LRAVLRYPIITENKLAFIIIAFFVLECVDKLLYVYRIDLNILTQVAKTIFLILLLAELVISKNKRVLIYFLVFISLFFIGQYQLKFEFQNIVLFGKYLLPLVFFEVANKMKLSKSQFEFFFNVFKKIMVFNSVLIVIGVVLSVELFKTYLGVRFGYNGMLRSASAGSYVYLMSLVGLVVYSGPKVIFSKSFWIIFIASFFVGTKILYLGISVISLWIFFNSHIKFKVILITLLIALISFASYFLFYKEQIFNDIIQNNSVFSALFSLRDRLFIENTIPYINENWNIMNYIFGGVQDYDAVRPQMEIVDIFLFWGLLGGIIYLFIYGKLFIEGIKTNSTNLTFLSLIIFSFLISGNFITYSIMATFALALKTIMTYKSCNY